MSKPIRGCKLIARAAGLLAPFRPGLNGSSGLRVVAAAVAVHLGQSVPIERKAQWQLLGDFVNGSTGNLEPIPQKRQAFFFSKAWLTLRYRVLVERGARCECCGATSADGVKIHVDHIKPRSIFPELALEKANLQVLCEPCNLGKSNKDQTDWRVGSTLQ